MEEKNDKSMYINLFEAFVTFILGYLFVRSVIGEKLGLGIFLFASGYIGIAVFQMIRQYKKDGRRGIKPSTHWLFIVWLYALTFLITDNDTLKAFALMIELCVVPYGVFSVFGNRWKERLEENFFLEWIKSNILVPFGNFGVFFVHLFCLNGKKGKTVRYILLGVLIAAIPTVIVFNLLSEDVLFAGAFSKLIRMISENLIENLFFFFLSVPVTMYLYASLYGCANNSLTDVLNPEKQEKTISDFRKMPMTVTATAMTPIILLYVFYCILHLNRYLSAFKGIVPQEYSTATYARSGFFELCIVGIINIMILLLGNAFSMRRKDGRKTTVWKVYSAVFSVLTVLLVVSAVGKMVLYISIYGMTVKRLLALWAMIGIAFVFIYVVIGQFSENFPVYRASFATLTVMFLLCVLVGPDRLAAGYNVRAYEKGRLETVDVEAINEMSGEAVPYLIRLSKEDSEVGQIAKQKLKEKSYDTDLLHENIASLKAEYLIKTAIGEEKNINQEPVSEKNLRFKVIPIGTAEWKNFYCLVDCDGVAESVGVQNAEGENLVSGEAVYFDIALPDEITDYMNLSLYGVLSSGVQTELALWTEYDFKEADGAVFYAELLPNGTPVLEISR